ncbi:MAG: hypothetical protein SVP52_06030 [Chloroflexota bacterium]|nr:hypothetical protein [Chloroflexota bacterium]
MKRWYLYALIGLIFGIFDWFYLDWLEHGLGPNLGENPFIVKTIILGLNYGIWLVPIIPVTLYEARRAETIKTPIFAGMLTWSCAIFSYYAYYAILFSLGRLPHLDHFNIFSHDFIEVRATFWRWFKWIILFQFIEWIPIAVIGGGLTGAIIWWIRQRLKPEET